MGWHFRVAGTVIGKKHLPVIPKLASTLVAYGATASILLVWIADIEAVMKYVPFYRNNLRFPYEDDKRVFIQPRRDI